MGVNLSSFFASTICQTHAVFARHSPFNNYQCPRLEARFQAICRVLRFPKKVLIRETWLAEPVERRASRSSSTSRASRQACPEALRERRGEIGPALQGGGTEVRAPLSLLFLLRAPAGAIEPARRVNRPGGLRERRRKDGGRARPAYPPLKRRADLMPSRRDGPARRNPRRPGHGQGSSA